MPYIPVIEHSEAEGALKVIYDDLVKTRGKLAEVHKIQSLNPQTIVNHMDLYMSIMFGRSPLKRYQREMLAVIVSASNKCPYCIVHHGEALKHFWKDQEKVDLLATNYEDLELSDLDKALCDYACKLTVTPDQVNDSLIDAIRISGGTDRMVLDTALIISYFNFVNRMVLGLGVQLEDDGGAGYTYE